MFVSKGRIKNRAVGFFGWFECIRRCGGGAPYDPDEGCRQVYAIESWCGRG